MKMQNGQKKEPEIKARKKTTDPEGKPRLSGSSEAKARKFSKRILSSKMSP